MKSNTLKRRNQMRRASRRYYARQTLKRFGMGLTTRGTKRKRKTWPELGVLRGEQRKYERQRRERRAFIAAGLTWRGRERTNRRHPDIEHLHGRPRRRALLKILYREKRVPALERDWFKLRAEFGDTKPGEFLSVLERNAA